MDRRMLNDLMKQAQGLQAKMAQAQQAAAQKTVEATAGGGMVTVRMNGRQEMASLALDPEVVAAGDITMLQDLILAAVNEAVRKSQQMVADEMKGAGLQIPGLPLFGSP